MTFTAARLGIADRFGDEERTGSQLAGDIGADPTSVTRLLRTLAALGVLAEADPGRFSLTEAAGHRGHRPAAARRL